MKFDEHVENKIYEVDGVPIRVAAFFSEDRRTAEYIIEGSKPMTPLEVATILELCCSQIMKHVEVKRHPRTEELN